MKVTLNPAQEGFEDAATDTLTGRLGLTVIVTELDVAGLPETQLAFEVITHVTISPLARLLFKYVELLAPTLIPFSFH